MGGGGLSSGERLIPPKGRPENKDCLLDSLNLRASGNLASEAYPVGLPETGVTGDRAQKGIRILF